MTEHINPEGRRFIEVIDDYRIRFTADPLAGDVVPMSDGRPGVVIMRRENADGKIYMLTLPACMVNERAFMKAGGECRFDEYLILPK